MTVTSRSRHRRKDVVLFEIYKTRALKRRTLLNVALLLACFTTTNVLLAVDHYWVGGSGQWNDASHWSNSSGGTGGYGIPTAGDNVYFDHSSFTSDGQTVTIPTDAVCQDFVWDKITNQVNFAGPAGIALEVHGSYIMDLDVDNQFLGVTKFKSASAGNVIESRGVDFDGDLSFNGAGEWTLYSDLNAQNKTITVVQGSLKTNGRTIKCGSFVGSGIQAREVDLSTSNVFVSQGWNFQNTANLTFSGNDANVITMQTVTPSAVKPGNLSYGSLGMPKNTTCGTGAGQTPFTIDVTVSTDYLGEDVTCNGAQDAEICVSITGGVGPFTISWVGPTPMPPNTPCWTNVGAGTYTVVVIDQGQSNLPCSENITVSEPAALTLFSLAITDPTCNGNCDGIGNPTIIGGTGAYDFCWNPSPACTPGTQIANNLCTGFNTFTVTDDNGCVATIDTILNNPTPVSPNVSITNASCFGICDGQAVSNPSGSNGPPYSWSWSTSANTTDTETGLCAGPVTLTVTDVDGCSNDTTFTVTQPLQLAITLDNQLNLVCNGICTGELTASATNGTAPYTYDWYQGTFGSGTFVVTNGTATNLCAGDYYVVVTDANGCMDSLGTFTVSEPPAIMANATATDVLCEGNCNGSAAVTAQGGFGNIVCEWFELGAGSTGQVGPFANNLCPGSYFTVCTDANGCVMNSDTVVVGEPPAVIAFEVHTDITCNGFCDGTATATGFGGVGGFNFDWYQVPSTLIGNGPNIANLCPGNYFMVATDANGCDDTTAVFTIAEPAILDPQITLSQISCHGICDGSAVVLTTGGTAVVDYNYLWEDVTGAPITIAQGLGVNAVNSLCPGDYQVTISDDNACDSTLTFTITQPAILLATTTGTNVSCGGACDGTATVTTIGGTAPVGCSWFMVPATPMGVTTPTITNLCPGDYYTLCTDANGCTTFSDTITITEPAVLNVTASAASVTCFGLCDGTLSAAITGGTANYIVNWQDNINGGSVGVGNPLLNVCPGEYFASVTDANGCPAQSNVVVIGEPTQIDPTLIVNDISCNGACDGDAAVNVTGGTVAVDYNFLWENVTGFPVTVAQGPGITSINNLCPGNYQLTITDDNACDSVLTFTLTDPPILDLTLNPSNPLCNAACDGSITSNTTGGTPPYTYQWHSGPTATNPINGETNPDLLGLCAGTYTLIVTDDNGCTDTETVTLIDPPGMTITLDGVTSSACLGACSGTISITVTGGAAPYTFDWVYTLNFNQVPNTDEDPTGLCADDYSVIVTDANGCMDTLTGIVVPTNPLVGGTLAVNQITCNGVCDGSATVTPIGGLPPYTFDWQNSTPTTIGIGSTVNGLCPDNYQVIITDGNGCASAPLVFSITEPTAITTTTDSIATSCIGACDGSAIVAPSGGTGALNVTWPTIPATGTTVNNLCAGVYDVTIIDDNGCQLDTFVEVTEPFVISVTAVEDDILCNGVCSGIATANVTGGTMPYTYQWYLNGNPINPSNQQVLTNLCPGNYFVEVTDANGCFAGSNTVTINEPTPLALSMTNVVDNVCNGDCAGTAEVTITGGTAPYTVLWPSGGTNTLETGLCAGTWQVIVTDDNGCQDSLTVTITEPAPYDLTVTSTDVSCFGDCDGSATVTVNSGGTLPYTYQWNDPAMQNTPTAINLCPGTYTCTVSDANSCDSVVVVVINEPLDLSITSNIVEPDCDANCNGQAYVTVSGGTPAYTYQWTDAVGTIVSTIDTANNLCAGTYDVLVTDANNCTVTTQVVLTAPSGLSGTATSSFASCGLCDAVSTLTVSGGTPPYSVFNWNGPCGPATGQGTPSVTGVSAGIYQVEVQDANGCTDFIPVLINNVPAELIDADSVDVSCDGNCDGEVTFNYLLGGCVDGPCNTQWYDILVNPLPGGTNVQTVSNLCAGQYIIEVTNASNCTVFDTTTINSPTTILPNEVIVDASCNGDCDGEVTLTPTGGVPPYTYNWSSGGNGPVEGGLCAGTYTVTIADATLCDTVLTVTVGEPVAIDVSVTATTDVSCPGGADGSATIFPTGGTVAVDYTYQWTNCASGSVVGTGATATGLAAGDYQVTVTDDNNCSETSICVTVNEPAPLVVVVTPQDANCFGACDGWAEVVVTGGTPNYTYDWQDATGTLGVNNDTITGLCAGNYSLIVTDNNACVAATVNFSINEPVEIIASATTTDVSCNGLCDGTATVTFTGGVLPVSYQWYTGAGTMVPGGTSATATNLCPDDYFVVVTDLTGCIDTSATVTVNEPAPLISNAVVTDVQCANDCDGEILLVPTGGTAPYTQLWNTGATANPLTGLCPGTYDVAITDANGCVLLDTFVIDEPAILDATLTSNFSTCNACDGSATVNPFGGTPPYTYNWYDDGGQTTPIAINLCAGVHFVEVTDGNGCVDTFSVGVSDLGAEVLTTDSTDVTCFGGNDGSATVIYTCSTGAGTCTNAWFDASGPLAGTGTTITGLTAGIYTVEVENGLGCIATASITVNEPLPFAANDSVVDASCAGGCDGEIYVAATGGTPGYTYDWPSIPSTNDTLLNVCAGNYDVTITDAVGCDTTFTITVNAPVVLDVSNITATDITCNGAADGTAEVFPVGGTLNPGNDYTYNWIDCGTGLPIPQTNAQATGLAAGSYQVEVTDDNNCTATTICVTINEPPVLATSTVVTDVTCNGAVDGFVDLTITGGTPPYTQVWNAGGIITEDLQNVGAGTYTVTVTDAAGCVTSETVTINEPTIVSATFTSVDATCGVCDGTATITPSGGTGPYNFAWSNGATTATATNLCAGVYTVAITDAAGCTENVTVTINNANAPTVDNVVVVDASCFGVCDGEATVVVSGGIAPYTYNWVHDGSTNPVINGLCAGTYNCEVTDAQGCLVVATAVINEPTQIVDNNIITPTTCGGADGEITVNPTGGSGSGYTFSWSPIPFAGNSATGLAAGFYEVIITDGSGCSETFSYAVSGSNGPQVTIVGTDVNCNGVCDGAADATVLAGTGPFTYTWLDATGAPIGQTTEDAIDLCAGDYTLAVTDANGCGAFAAVTINEPTVLSVGTPFVQDLSCGGACDGSANVNVVGGTLPYTFNWVDGGGAPVGGSQDSISNVCADTYTVDVTDANGCTLGPINITVNEPTTITATFVVVDASCNLADGSAQAIPSGGTPGYTFQWFDFAGNALGTNDLQAGLSSAAGPYTVEITDAAGCSEAISVAISDVNGPTITVNSITDVTCFGDCDGAVDVTGNGANPPFSYVWNQGPIISEDLAGVCPGTYIVEITDAVGCIGFDTVVVGEPAALGGSFAVTDATCGDCDGSATLTMATGVAPFTYAWSNSGTSSTENNLCAGSYQALVTDANGCTVVLDTVVNNTGGPTGETVAVTPVTCPGLCNGTANVTPVGGTAPYVYLWPHNGATTPALTGLCAGTYNCEITDASGCIRIATVVITEPAPFADSTFISPTTCGGADGVINTTISGGTAPYTYTWSSSAGGGNSPIATNVPAGVHLLDVTDANGCANTFVFTMPTTTSPTALLQITDASCYSACDGVIDASSTLNGTAPYTYTLLNGVGTPTGATGAIVNGLCAGDYIMQIDDAAGCVGFSNATINQPDSIFFNIPTIIDATCGGACDGQVGVIANGGTLGYTYNWMPSGIVGATAASLCAGVHDVTVTDANGCTATQTVTVNEPASIIVAVDNVIDALCLTASDGSIDISVSGGAGGYTFSWAPSGDITEDITNVSPGDYIVTVTDANNCSVMDTITVGAQIVVTADAGNDTTICENTLLTLIGTGVNAATFQWEDGGTVIGVDDTLSYTPGIGTHTLVLTTTNGPCTATDTIVVNVVSNPIADAGPDVEAIEESIVTIGGAPTGSAGSTIIWSPGLFLNDSTLANPDLTVTQELTYVVTVISPDGCIGVDSVNVLPLPQITFPNGFSPNGDGVNEVWVIDLIDEFPEAEVEVYNRWGQMLFRSVGYQTPWDGTYNGQPVPVGTYYYVILLNHPAYPDAFTGPITILR